MQINGTVYEQHLTTQFTSLIVIAAIIYSEIVQCCKFPQGFNDNTIWVVVGSDRK